MPISKIIVFLDMVGNICNRKTQILCHNRNFRILPIKIKFKSFLTEVCSNMNTHITYPNNTLQKQVLQAVKYKRHLVACSGKPADF